MPTTHRSLICCNASGMSGGFCLYETGATASIGQAWSLVWRMERVPAGGRVLFQWDDADEGIAWAMTQTVEVGGMFFAIQSIRQPSPENHTVRLLPDNGTWVLSDVRQVQTSVEKMPGTFSVLCGNGIPHNTVAVAWCRGGLPVIAVRAHAHTRLSIKRHRQLRVGFGNFKPGQMIDPTHVPTSMALPATCLVSPHTLTLSPDMTWASAPTRGQDRWL